MNATTPETVPPLCPDLNQLSPEGCNLGFAPEDSLFHPSDANTSIGEFFNQTALKNPDHIAVSMDGEETTYSQLLESSDKIASNIIQLTNHGSAPVVNFLPKGKNLIAAMLGILKARKIVVPVDISDPEARIRAIIRISGARLLLVDSTSEHAAQSFASPELKILNVEHLDKSKAPLPEVRPHDDALLIFTSGSTGEPKGVVTQHGPLLGIALKGFALCRLRPEDRIATSANEAYAMACINNLYGILSGATLFPLDPRRLGPRGIGKALIDNRITYYLTIKNLFNETLRAIAPTTRFTDLRMLRFSGEPLRASDLELLRPHLTDSCVIAVNYSATEVPGMTIQFIQKDTVIDSPTVPIGYPIKGIRIDLVNENGAPVTEGDVGEIVATTRDMARGYWNDPARTARQFTPDPSDPNLRSYHTGDLARRRPDGALEHMGRRDHQVKIKGLRIELAEVEAALNRASAVADCVVNPFDDAEGNLRLAAYWIQATDQTSPTPAELRRVVSEHMPPAASPSVYMRLKEFPKTVNGKIKRNALPDPSGFFRSDLREVKIPETDLEKTVCEKWEKTFGISPIRTDDDFFSLGGDSLLGARVIAELSEELELRLSPASIAYAPTPNQLANYVDRLSQYAKIDHLVTIHPDGDRPPLILVSGWPGEAHVFADLIPRLARDQPVFNLEPTGGGTGVPYDFPTVEAAARAFLAPLQKLVGDADCTLIGYCHSGLVALELARLFSNAGGRPPRVITLDSSAGNQRYARLQDAMYTWDRFRGRSESQRIKRFLAIRHRLDKLRPRREESPFDVTRRIATGFGSKISRLKSQLNEDASVSDQAGNEVSPTYKSRHTVFFAHTPRPYAGRIVAVHGEQTHLYAGDPTPWAKSWKSIARGKLSLIDVPGNHETLVRPPHVNLLAQMINEQLQGN